MNRKILCVDDEENVLRAFERNLRLHFEVETAVGPIAGLSAIAARGPYAVVISDLRMPEMDGIQFLATVRKQSPDTVRLILSGNADLQAAIAAVNEGSIFQFLTKPCPVDKLRSAIDGALKQYQLIIAERELLEHTLNGSVSMMTEVLSVVSPLAFSRSSRIRRYPRRRGWRGFSVHDQHGVAGNVL
jgi:DNA-binding NtrC family response regulator